MIVNTTVLALNYYLYIHAYMYLNKVIGEEAKACWQPEASL